MSFLWCCFFLDKNLKNNVIYLTVSICEMCEAESKMIYILFYDAFKSDQMYGCLFTLDDSQKLTTKYAPT